MCVASLIQHIFKVHLCYSMYQHFVIFLWLNNIQSYRYTTFYLSIHHMMDILLFGYHEYCCNEHSCTKFVLRASTAVKQVKLLSTALGIVCVLVAPLPVYLPAQGLGKPAENGSSVGPLPPTWKIWMKLKALGFGLAQSWPLAIQGDKPADERSLSVTLLK